MLVRLTRSLSFQLVRTVVLVTVLVGLIISAIQISIDFASQTRLLDENIQSLASIVKDPATKIVFSFDPATANELLRGVLKHPSVTSSKIILADGTVFAEQQKPLAAHSDRKLNDWLFNSTKLYQWPLTWSFPDKQERLATLEITVDTYNYGRLFLERARITLFSTLLYALMLTITVLLVFYYLVVRPLTNVIESISQLNVDAPEKKRLIEPAGHDQDEIGLLAKLTNQHLEAISTSLHQVREAEEKLKHYSDGLETIVSERTQALTVSLEELQTTQGKLIESEKLAALGGLVAGVAHEVNTPLGVAVTAASILKDTLDDMQNQFNTEALTAEGLQNLISLAQDSHQILTSNISRATKLIGDFKMTAVDQLSETCCEFYIAEVVGALITSLQPETKKIPVTLHLHCPNELVINSLPGVLTQVLSNLIMNSIYHGFEKTEYHHIEPPQINITIQALNDAKDNPTDEQILIEYQDNGIGIISELHQRIFEPFFTTKRGKGGSGLGLNIVYNLVTRKLFGRLEFESAVNQGVHFKLYLPSTLHSSTLHLKKSSVKSMP